MISLNPVAFLHLTRSAGARTGHLAPVVPVELRTRPGRADLLVKREGVRDRPYDFAPLLQGNRLDPSGSAGRRPDGPSGWSGGVVDAVLRQVKRIRADQSSRCLRLPVDGVSLRGRLRLGRCFAWRDGVSRGWRVTGGRVGRWCRGA